MPFLKTLDLLAALKTRLEAMTAPDATPLFEQVEYFDTQDIREAITKRLAVTKGRLCFIVPSGETYTTQESNVVMLAKRIAEFDLLICDRDWAESGHEANFGGPENLGILAMKDLVVETLSGVTLGLSAYTMLIPSFGDFLKLAPENKDLPGRECWVQSFTTLAGDMRVGRANA